MELVTRLPWTHPRKVEIEQAVRSFLDRCRPNAGLKVTLEAGPAGEGDAFAVVVKVVTALAVRSAVIDSDHDAEWIRAVVGALVKE